MSAPETTSKGRPSLLSETAPGAADHSSRILASLEGRVADQHATRGGRLKKQWIAAKQWVATAIVVGGVCAIGAWQWQHSRDDAPAYVAAQLRRDGPVVPSVESARATPSVDAPASVVQAAVIVPEASPSPSGGAGTDPLSRALKNGALPSAGQGVSTADIAKPATNERSAAVGKPVATYADRHRAEQRLAARTQRHAKKPAQPDDSDADLLSVLVARTRPYEAHVSAPGRASAKARVVSLAARVKECEKSNFFEAQICRWHVCSNSWGKDPACPSANVAPAPH